MLVCDSCKEKEIDFKKEYIKYRYGHYGSTYATCSNLYFCDIDCLLEFFDIRKAESDTEEEE